MANLDQPEFSSLDATMIKRKAIHGAQVIFFRRVSGFLINLVGTILLARLAGPTVWGLFATAFFLMNIVQGALRWGTTVYLIQRSDEPTTEEIETIFTFQQTVGGLAALGIFVAARPLAYFYGYAELIPLAVSVGIAALMYSWSSVPLAMLDRELQYTKTQIVDLLDIIVFNTIAIAGVALGFGTMAVAVANILKAISVAIVANVFHPIKPVFRIYPRLLRSILTSGGSYAFFSWSAWLNASILPVVLGPSVGVAGIGYVQLGYRLLSYPKTIADVGYWISLTALARAQHDLKVFNKGIQKILSGSLFIIVPLSSTFVALSPWWVHLIYGDPWDPVTTVMLIGVLAIVLEVISFTVANSMFALGSNTAVLKYQVLYSVLLWPCSVGLIQKLGYVGFPLAYLLANLAIVFLLYSFQRCGGQLNYLSLARSLIFLIVVSFAGWFLSEHGYWFITMALSAVVVTYHTLGTVDQREILREVVHNAMPHLRLDRFIRLFGKAQSI